MEELLTSGFGPSSLPSTIVHCCQIYECWGIIESVICKKSIKINSFCSFFIIFFSLTVFVQLHCIAISLEMSPLCVYLQLWRSLNMLSCVPLHEWLSVLLKVFRGFSLCLIYFFFFGAFHCVMCAHVSTNTCTTKCQGTNTYAHILIFLVVP